MPDILHSVGVTRARVGTSGWRYPPWRRTFYPEGLAQRRELEHLSRRVDTIEINGSFYSLQQPSSWQAWARETPDDFVFAVKGPRFVTHMKQLRDVATPVANFLASGVLALGPKLGPVLWQLPPRMRFDASRVAAFLELLPRTTAAAARLAEQHDERLDGRALTATDADRPLRHAVEPRHESFRDPAFAELLRANGIALVMADSPGTWPVFDEGDGRLPLRPPARRRRAVRLGLHAVRVGRMGETGARVAGRRRRVRLLRQRRESARPVRRPGAGPTAQLTRLVRSPHSFSRSSNFCTLPVDVLGSASTISTSRGAL